MVEPSMESALGACLREGLQGRWPLRLAVLFGSAASGGQRRDSDVDVAILPAGSWTDSMERDLYVALTRAVDVHVDLVDLRCAPTLLLWEIATTGWPLLERSPGEFARFQARAAGEYIDFAPALFHYGELFRRRLAGRGRAGA